jgi:hypothetical protein
MNPCSRMTDLLGKGEDSWSSMIGNGQGETEIPVDPAE